MDPVVGSYSDGISPARCNLCKALNLEGNRDLKPKISSNALYKESFCHMNFDKRHIIFAKGGTLKEVFNDVIYSTVYPKNASFDISVYDSQVDAINRKKPNY